VPWDGNKITSLANCNSRKAYIARTYSIPLRALRCQRYSYTCGEGGPYYWVLEIDQDASLVAGTTSRPESASDIPTLVAC
jgi:hypothetical protein